MLRLAVKVRRTGDCGDYGHNCDHVYACDRGYGYARGAIRSGSGSGSAWCHSIFRVSSIVVYWQLVCLESGNANVNEHERGCGHDGCGRYAAWWLGERSYLPLLQIWCLW